MCNTLCIMCVIIDYDYAAIHTIPQSVITVTLSANLGMLTLQSICSIRCLIHKYYAFFYIAISTTQLNISSLTTLLTPLWPARCKWFLIGCYLGIEIGTLEAIKKDYRDISEECLVALLTTWLRGTNPIPTWKALVDVLKSPPVGIQLNLEPLS